MTDVRRHQPQLAPVGRYQLPSVKHTLYNPRLPSLRRMDMDDSSAKLPNEHNRTTTLCSLDDFRACRTISTTGTDLPAQLACKEVTSTGQSLQRIKIKPFDWRSFARTLSGPGSSRAFQDKTQFSGYAGRHLPPQVTSAWQYTLKQEPTTDKSTQRPLPVPATIYGRHRDMFTTFTITPSAWH
eukprot:m.6396 g.6396  ORF g.6396 m.6396 type:complete len:183 (+) comp15785_c0_seq1:64-612(+)